MNYATDYSTDTLLQLRFALRSLRKKQRLTQAQAGDLIGVSQMRIAQIEADPMKPSFDQISRLVAALGARILISPLGSLVLSEPRQPSRTKRKTKADKLRAELENANW